MLPLSMHFNHDNIDFSLLSLSQIRLDSRYTQFRPCFVFNLHWQSIVSLIIWTRHRISHLKVKSNLEKPNPDKIKWNLLIEMKFWPSILLWIIYYNFFLASFSTFYENDSLYHWPCSTPVRSFINNYIESRFDFFFYIHWFHIVFSFLLKWKI